MVGNPLNTESSTLGVKGFSHPGKLYPDFGVSLTEREYTNREIPRFVSLWKVGHLEET
jgi:hypothetical protein